MLTKLKTSFVSLFLLGLLTTACSAKETTASEQVTVEPETVKTIAVKSEQEAVSEVTQSSERTIDERYAALFDAAKDAVKQSLLENPNNFVSDTHYDEFGSRQERVTQSDKIEVVEFFSYGCGHCFNAEPYMHAYEKQVADDVEFLRVPVSFNPFFEHLARAFYAAKGLDASEEAHIAMFDAIHIKRQDFRTVEAVADFYAEYGVNKEQFIKAFNSFSVNAQLKRDKQLSQAYQVTGVPTVIVNGAYNTGGVKAGNFGTWFQILDFLTESERKK